MKNLKIKLFSFSLLAILIVSVFLTSCEQQEVLMQEQVIEQERALDKIISDFESDPILAEVKDLTYQIQNNTRSSILESKVSIETIAEYHKNHEYDALQEIFADEQLPNLVARHNELSYTLQHKYPELYGNLEVETNNDIAMSLNVMMADDISDRWWCNWRYWVCATAAGAPTVVCMATTLPTIVLPVFCYLGYTAALVICADSYC